MAKYKYILFDMDNTLLDFSRAEYLAFRETAENCGLVYSEELYADYSEINDSLWKRLEVGTITLEALKTERFRLLLGRLGHGDNDEREALAVAMKKEYIRALGQQGCLIENAVEVCAALSKKYRMFIVTNGIADIQISRFAISGLEPYFEKMFISENIGYTKPDKGYFDYVLNAVGDSDRSAYLVIGDSLTSDCDGAIAYGLDICRFNPKNQPDKGRILTYNISKLTDLFEII
ncbi:MAG: noncanonical pyrimidine nucleotidase, YjjG family [Ruminococcaceae bacterium]|nr:noncanonical pyrimidine nucleotidase, YjjG family [Oscillospiraceae bacterium]